MGIVAAGVTLLGVKLGGKSLELWYYILIGVLPALAVFCTLFFIFRPNSKKVARRLDEDYALEERVQTALQYSSQSGAVIELQRRNAEEILGSVTAAKGSYKRSPKNILAAYILPFVLVPIIALCVFVPAIAVPAKTEKPTPLSPPDPSDLPFVLTEAHKSGLNSLIDDVEASELSEGLKTKVTGYITDLISDLQAEDMTRGKMQTTVRNCIYDVNADITATDTYYRIASALKNGDLLNFAQAVTAGVGANKNFAFINYLQVEDFSENKVILVQQETAEKLAEFRAEFAVNIAEGAEDKISSAAADIAAALNGSNVSPTDGLYITVYDLSLKLSEIDSVTDQAIQADLDAVFEEFTAEFNEKLASQSYDIAMNEYICYRLEDLFGLEHEDFGYQDINPGTGDTGDGDDDDDQNHAGGYGPGDVIYGSDDLVYDPATGEYVPYGELFNYYYSTVLELMTSGNFTPEQQEIITKYYDILLKGFEAD